MANPVIKVDGLSKIFRLGVLGAGSLREDVKSFWRSVQGREPIFETGSKNHVALDDLSFEVNPGEVVGVIGGNGAGKSTLLKILSRITEPSKGRIEMNGRVGSLLEVGTGFHPELTGRENIYLNGAILGMSRKEVAMKFDEIVSFAECEKFIDTPVKRYSSGMRVRVAFAVAAHLEPEIMIIDEVLAVGDMAFQTKCIGKMEDVAKQGRTILFVSHNMGTIRQLCDRSIVLQKGKLIADTNTNDAVGIYLDQLENTGNDAFGPNNPLRKLKGKAQFTGLEIRSDTGLPIQDAVGGETLHFDVFYDTHGEEVDEMRLDIWNDFGVVATSLNSRFVGIGKIKGRGRLRFTLKDLPLSRGRYRVSLVCHCYRNLSDAVPNASGFSISSGSIYTSGMSAKSKNCTVHLPFSCELESEETQRAAV